MSLTFDVMELAGRNQRVYVNGRIDAQTQGRFEESMNGWLFDPPPALVLDLAKLEYINSTGIRILLAARKTLMANGGTLVLVNAQSQIRKVFELLQAVKVSEMFKDAAELDAYLDALQKQHEQRSEL